MDQAAVDAFVLVPAHGHQQVPVGVPVSHHPRVNIPIGVRDGGIRRQDVPHNLTIRLYGIHVRMPSVRGSNTTSRTR
jgi:hypothetical protein